MQPDKQGKAFAAGEMQKLLRPRSGSNSWWSIRRGRPGRHPRRSIPLDEPSAIIDLAQWLSLFLHAGRVGGGTGKAGPVTPGELSGGSLCLAER